MIIMDAKWQKMPNNNKKTVTIGVLHVMVCDEATLLEIQPMVGLAHGPAD